MGIDTLKQSLKPVIEGAVMEGQFTLASGAKSTYYIDGKMATLTQKGAHLASQIFFEMIHKTDVNAIGGPSIGANPIVSTLGHVCFEQGLPLKMFYVRREEKKHGAQKWIEGPPLEKGDRAVILEDVITSGKSALRAVERVRETGAEVSTVLCIVDRQSGGEEALKKEGLELKTIFTVSDLGIQ